jgi:hydroxyethylthiazole kinase-like sugar kinase family protein
MGQAGRSLDIRLPQRRRAQALAILLAGAGIALLLIQATFRQGEAAVAAVILRLTGQGHAVSLGTSVFFIHGDRWIGYVVATGCTAALLIAPFFFLAAGLLFVAA